MITTLKITTLLAGGKSLRPAGGLEREKWRIEFSIHTVIASIFKKESGGYACAGVQGAFWQPCCLLEE